MKKIIAALALALSLAAGTAPALAAEGAARPANPVDQFTGTVWMQTSHDNKAAFLFGIDTAITVEYFVNSKAAEKAVALGMREVAVKVCGPGQGRETAVRAVQQAGLTVSSIKDVTPIPHNGCRPPKARRV